MELGVIGTLCSMYSEADIADRVLYMTDTAVEKEPLPNFF